MRQMTYDAYRMSILWQILEELQKRSTATWACIWGDFPGSRGGEVSFWEDRWWIHLRWRACQPLTATQPVILNLGHPSPSPQLPIYCFLVEPLFRILPVSTSLAPSPPQPMVMWLLFQLCFQTCFRMSIASCLWTQGTLTSLCQTEIH